MALESKPDVRAEIGQCISPILRGDLRSEADQPALDVSWSRAPPARLDDIPYKIALAELCAEQRLDGLLEALAVSLGPVTDVRYARCVGRIGKVLHGEQATSILSARLKLAGQEQDRKMLLLAIGATNTESALEALLRMSKTDAAVTAALAEHTSPRARAAVADRK